MIKIFHTTEFDIPTLKFVVLGFRLYVKKIADD